MVRKKRLNMETVDFSLERIECSKEEIDKRNIEKMRELYNRKQLKQKTLLLLIREKIEDSVLSKHYFPLDLFKIIFFECFDKLTDKELLRRSNRHIEKRGKVGENINLSYIKKNEKEVLELEDESCYDCLLYSCASDNLKVVELILKKGVYLDRVNKHGNTPLFWSIKNKNREIGQKLLEAGSKMNNGYIKSYIRSDGKIAIDSMLTVFNEQQFIMFYEFKGKILPPLKKNILFVYSVIQKERYYKVLGIIAKELLPINKKAYYLCTRLTNDNNKEITELIQKYYFFYIKLFPEEEENEENECHTKKIKLED